MSAKKVEGGYRDRVRIGNGKREWITLAVPTEAVAENRFARLRDMSKRLVKARKLEAAADLVKDAAAAAADAKAFAGIERAARELCSTSSGPTRPKTVRDLAEEFTSGDLHRRHPRHVDKGGKTDETRKREAQRLDALCSVIGDIAVTELTLEDAERAIDALPKTLGQGTRRTYEQVLFHLFKIARYPLKLIDVSPIPPEFVSSQGKPAATPFLYPLEEAQFQRYAPPNAGALTLETRLLIGVACREGFRPSGAAGLRWDDLDLVRGTVTHQNKTEDSRMWTLDPGALAALRVYERDAKTEWVFPSYHLPDGAPGGNGKTRRMKLAAEFRAGLEAAGVTRRDLHHERTRLRRSIRAHDLRTSFVTLALALGRGEGWVMARTGHTESAMIKKYKRLIRTAEELHLGWFLPLDELLGLEGPVMVSVPAQIGGQGVGYGVGHGPRNTEKKAMRDATLYSFSGPPEDAHGSKTPEKSASGNAGGHVAVAQASGVGHDSSPLELLRAAARGALEESNWALLHSLEPLIDAEIKRAAAAAPKPPVSLEAVRAKREGAK